MTKKMMGVIYRAFKEGKLADVDKEDISNAYDYIDRMYNFDFQRKEGQHLTNRLRQAVNAIFDNDYETANEIVRNFKSVELY